jgi:predicted Zn-dependent protease
MARAFPWWAVAAALVFFPSWLHAHPWSDERLALLDAQIAAQPRNAVLYLERGNLHCADGRWDAALGDYERAAQYAPDPDAVDLARGELFLKAGRPQAAERALNGFLTRHPDHPRALLARARTRVQLAHSAEAVADFSRAIVLQPSAKPDLYLERARVLVDAGKRDEAIAGLDEAIARLGPLTVLERAAFSIELERGRHEAALRRLDRLTAASPSPETWLALRGDILIQAARPDEARAAFEAALASLASRPEPRRRTQALQALERRIRSALEQLGTNRAPAVSAVRAGIDPR